jgi:glycosyltransferase involved in cell wall biosynthesis
VSTLPRISVIVATRDRPRLLRRAVSSVAGQRYPEVEVCVANDGGAPVEEALSGVGVDVRLVNLPRRIGVPGARNAALRLATGEFAAYLDDDDEFLEDHLELSYRRLADAGADACVSSVWCRHEAGLSLDFRYPFDTAFLPVTNAHPPVSLLHRLGSERDLFDRALTVMEDWDLLQRLHALDGLTFVGRTEPTAVYDRVAALATSMERRPAAVFQKDYRYIIAKWAAWSRDDRIAGLQQRVIDWYDRQIESGERLDYEAFLDDLWREFHAVSLTTRGGPR